jgi:hypothetical protein
VKNFCSPKVKPIDPTYPNVRYISGHPFGRFSDKSSFQPRLFTTTDPARPLAGFKAMKEGAEVAKLTAYYGQFF